MWENIFKYITENMILFKIYHLGSSNSKKSIPKKKRERERERERDNLIECHFQQHGLT